MKRLTPTKSPNDLKDYLALELENGLKILIVSDLECDKAAASVSVGVGSMNDPDNIPGLAHLCEHLLSIQINDKPGLKPFNSFIAEHGGMFNAFTARDQTNFHFDVDTNVFTIALQRFSQFFTTIPNLTENDIEREISIVDAEHMSKVNKDAWRKMAVDASTSKKGHPFQKFSTGNKTTLLEMPKKMGISVLSAAREFRAKYYVANIMTLVVYAKDTLKNLEDLCVQLFSQIKDNKNIALPQWNEWPYGPAELRKRIDIVSLSDIRDFFIVFPMANMRPYYKTFPHGYITRLIGNRGPGSLYSFLSDLQWVETSYMNASVPARGFGELTVGFQLTKAGLDHIDQVILHSFQYIKMLKNKGPQKQFWREMQEVMYLKFLHQDKEVPVDFSQRMSNLMHVYPLQDILSVGSILTAYDAALIEKYMEYMDPENCRIVTVCRANGMLLKNKTEYFHDHWYGSQYTVTDFTAEQIQQWKFCETPNHFYLPKENKFIPTNFELKYKQDDNLTKRKLCWSPILISNTTLCKAWFLQDDEFQMAKGVIRLDIFSPLSVVDPISYNLNQIWFLTLKSLLSDQFYQATVAGSYHGVKPTLHGVEITVSGFSDKLLVLMEEIMLSIVESVRMKSTFGKHFCTAKDRYTTGLLNLKNLPQSNITNHYFSLLLREKRFSYDELIDAIPDTTEKNLALYMTGFFFRAYFEWMVYGNFTRQEAEDLVNVCTGNIIKIFNTRSVLPSQNIRFREVCLSPGIQFIFRSEIPTAGNSCGILIQVGVLNMRESLILEVIDQIIFEPLFTQLRHQEFMGYIVRSSVRKSNGCQGLLIFLQGDKQPATMSDRVFAVLERIEKRLSDMTSQEFNQQKSAVRLRKADNPKSMFMLFNKLWNSEVVSRRYDFGRIEKELAMLEIITKSEVMQYFRDHICNTSPTRKVLQIHLNSSRDREIGNTTNTSNEHDAIPSLGKPTNMSAESGKSENSKYVIISNITDWKMGMGLYPASSSERDE